MPEKTELSANGHALAYVRIEIVDENGVVVPDAAVKLHADVEGAGKPAAFGSANPITDENYTTGDFISYRGVATAIIQNCPNAALSIFSCSSPISPANIFATSLKDISYTISGSISTSIMEARNPRIFGLLIRSSIVESTL